MIKINDQHTVPLDEALFVFALQSEAADVFADYRHVICGIGKVNASYALLKAIQEKRPSLIVNLGSAGSATYKKGEVVCCTKFVQRDMDVRALGHQLYETPWSGIPPVMEYGLAMEGLPEAACGTGDHFETAHATDMYQVVDMEAYALALVAKKENIPFLSLKYISDGADGQAAEDWPIQVHNAAVAFEAALQLPKKDLAI